VAGLEIPYGKNEYDAAGGALGEAVEVFQDRSPACPYLPTPRMLSKAMFLSMT